MPTIISVFVQSAMIGLALVAVIRGHSDEPNEAYWKLLSTRESSTFFTGTGSQRILALLAHTMDGPDTSSDRFEDALALCRKARYGPKLAWSLCDYADMRLERSIEGDQAKAMFLLDESLAISSELGIRPLKERVLSWRDILME